MAEYDEFFDLERNRTSQSYAFGLHYQTYTHDVDSDDIVNDEIEYRTYYVQAFTPCYFIRIEGKRFTGIVSITEDNILLYPVFDYDGKPLHISGRYFDTLIQMADAYAVIEENACHLPMNKIRKRYTSMQLHVSGKISQFTAPDYCLP